MNKVLVNGDNHQPYFGGDIQLHLRVNGSWQHRGTYADGGNYTYIRKVRGSDYKGVASKGVGEIDNGNTQIRIEVK